MCDRTPLFSGVSGFLLRIVRLCYRITSLSRLIEQFLTDFLAFLGIFWHQNVSDVLSDPHVFLSATPLL